MRFAVTILITVLLSSSSFSLDDELLQNKASRALQRAEEWYDRLMVNATINGAQSPKRRGTKTTPESVVMERNYVVYERALNTLTTKHNVSPTVAHQYLRQSSNAVCNRNIAFNCNGQQSSRYRTIDGTCNNLGNPLWGAAGTAQNRLFAPKYDDGTNAPRGGFNTRLPNARFISAQLHPDFNVTFNGITNMVPQFGQFLDHDMSITPEANRQCCSRTGDQTNCWPIGIFNNDPFYASKGQGCMDFTRSTPCSNPNNNNREQLNMNTAWIDGSMIYGSTSTRTDQLRAFVSGRLLTASNGPGFNGWLPSATQTTQLRGNNVQGSFIAGDDRINEMPGLAVLHNVFIQEHNRLADAYNAMNRGYTDQQIFNECRRVIGAMIQQVTYSEYLPTILGTQTMSDSRFRLTLPPRGSFTRYDSTVDGTILNEFSTGAYRFGHTLVSGLVQLLNSAFGQPGFVGTYDIKDQYFQSTQITQSSGRGYDWILTGLMEVNSQFFDPFVTRGMTNFLFANPGATFGSDLVARNIQRGRDHGIGPYADYRAMAKAPALGGNIAPSDMVQNQYDNLMSVYQGAANIDLFTGGLHEKPLPGACSGITFNTIKAEQFRRLCYGDRYFFTHSGVFNQPQLDVIRSQRLGDIICRNSKQLSTPSNVFRAVSSSNPRISCTDSSRSFNMANFIF